MDSGNEFKGVCKKYLESLNIELFIIESDLKVERFNRTLKEMMWRAFTNNNNKNYTNHLQDMVENYNNSLHSAINCAPSSVNKQNEKKIFEEQYGFSKNSRPFESISLKI
jgi:hypothetical protein